MNYYYKNLSLDSLEGEEWKDIKGYEGLYQISNLGRVKSLKRTCIKKYRETVCFNRVNNKILKQGESEYTSVRLFRLESGKRKGTTYCVHRIVARHFVKNPYNKPVINHLDGDKYNNVWTNFEFVTESENVQHAYNTGLKESLKGEQCGRSKLTLKEVLEIRSISRKIPATKIAEKYNVGQTAILCILNRETWRHV